jgi:hypothetical protein
MKKAITSLSIIALFLFTSSVFAQGIGLGLKAGANFANQDISDISTSSRTSFHGGAYLTIAFSEKWGIQPELLFSSQGSEIPDFNEIAQLDYFSIPILVRWKPISVLSFHAGPQFSTLLSAVDKSGDSIKDDFKGSDFGLAVGATVHLPLGLNGGLRYVWGFSDVADLNDDTSVKNTTWQIFVGWTFLGKQ